jgi:hypothetical protein
MPYNRIGTTTPDISIVPRGIISIKRPGSYLFNGVVTPYYMNSWFNVSVSKNHGTMTQLIASNNTPKATDGHTHSIPFSYVFHITKDDIIVNPTLVCNVEVQVQCGAANSLKWDSPTNWVHVTKLNQFFL